MTSLLIIVMTLLPAPAGVIQSSEQSVGEHDTFTRPSGGDQLGIAWRSECLLTLLPAPAGVIPNLEQIVGEHDTFTRTCGGDPLVIIV